MTRRAFGPLVIVSLLITAGWGQQPLDLKTALAEADAHNLELRATLQQRAMALAGISTARQTPNPTVTFGALRDVPHESVTIDQPIELGGKRGNRIAALNLSGSAEEMPLISTLEQLSSTGMQSNSDLAKTMQAMRTEERRLELAKSQRIPNVDLQAGADLNAPPDFNVGPKGQIAMQLPLFYREQGEISLAKARLELLRLTADSQRTNVAAQVTAAYYDFNAKAHQAEQFRNRMVPETVKLEEMARESYQAGKSNLLTLIDAQRKLNDVKKAYLDSLFSAQSSFASLEELVGASLD